MLKNTYCNDVSAVVVTYNPNLEYLRKGIEAIATQVAFIFIVDNASSINLVNFINNIYVPNSVRIILVQQNENFGVGTAHNIGINHVIDYGSRFVLLLDQDSQIEENMVVKLRSAYDSLNKSGHRVAAIGPQYRDADNSNLSKFVKVGFFRFLHCNEASDGSVAKADFLVSSGSLISIDAIETVGFMDGSLFIDHVDTEWCFRAKAKGFLIFGLYGAVMNHVLGEQRKTVFFMRERAVPFHKPFRYYYMFRNSILLYKRSYMPLNWKLADIARCIKMIVFFSLVGQRRLVCLKMMGLGIIDGLRGVSGKRNNL